MPDRTLRLRRSLLMTPGHRADRLVKAMQSAADGVVFDLEDGVPPARKPEARAAIAHVLLTHDPGPRERVVRLNGLGTADIAADLAALPLHRLDALMLPKLEDPATLPPFEAALRTHEAACGRQDPTPLILTIETPRGLLRGLSIVDATPNCDALFFGPGDYTAQTGGQITAEALHVPRAMIAALAGAAGCDALDAPFLTDLTDADATAADASIARALGFVGKIVFHPAQIDAVNATFAPSASELHQARQVVDGYAAAMAAGESVIRIGTTFIAMDLVPRMQRRLDLAGMIATRAATSAPRPSAPPPGAAPATGTPG